MSVENAATDSIVDDLIKSFETKSGLSGLPWELKSRPDAHAVVIYVLNPTERLFRVLEEVQRELPPSIGKPVLATLKKHSSKELLQTPEARLLLRTLSESLTVNRHTFGDEFFERYIKSVHGAEEQITAAGNHVVFGRRGSGKSSLLLYGMQMRVRRGQPFAWVDMQVYAQRDDNGVIVDVLHEILSQAAPALQNALAVEDVRRRIDALTTQEHVSEVQLRQLLPDLKRVFSSLASGNTDFAIFLDDLHVLAPEIQPRLLAAVYGFSRGNRVFLKLSAIESFTKLWQPSTRTGLETPHDVQTIKLDYSLTMTEKALEHIKNILDGHATYCGLPSVRVLCVNNDVLARLVWVAAGVPRDALNIFSQAMTKAAVKGQPRISVTNVNIAASEMVNDKLRDVEQDASGVFDETNVLLGEIREFCIKKERKNAFLIEILNDDPVYNGVRKLIDLRLLHVINEGITRDEAGRKYMALILDYGFYIGIRAARSVDLFNRSTGAAKWKDLRELPVFRKSA